MLNVYGASSWWRPINGTFWILDLFEKKMKQIKKLNATLPRNA